MLTQCSVCGCDYELSEYEVLNFQEDDEYVCEDCAADIIEYFEYMKIISN